MHVLIAPDSFKGSLSGVQAARAMAIGVRSVVRDATIAECPIADGGEGTVEVLLNALGGQAMQTTVTGPIGSPVVATWGLLGDGSTAVLEMAAASGMILLSGKAQNLLSATTYGTGELIRAALNAGAKKIIVGVGGSATNDGGSGMAEALGALFFDGTGRVIGRGGAALTSLERIDTAGIDSRVSGVEFVAACDVDNVLCGPEGASAVFGPQKGGSANDVAILDRALFHYGEVIKRSFGMNVLDLRSGGSAGGLGAGLAAFCNAKLLRGIDLILDMIGFDEQLKKADLVLTGEGRIDSQMKYGKALAGVLERSARRDVPVLGIAGSIEGSRSHYCRPGRFAEVVSLVEKGGSAEHSMINAYELIQQQTAGLLREWVRRNISTG